MEINDDNYDHGKIYTVRKKSARDNISIKRNSYRSFYNHNLKEADKVKHDAYNITISIGSSTRAVITLSENNILELFTGFLACKKEYEDYDGN